MIMKNKMTKDNAATFIADVCMDLLGHAYRNEVALLVGIASAESNFQQRYEYNGGPGRGLWQMNVDTAVSIFEDYLIYSAQRYQQLRKFAPSLITRQFQVPNGKDLEHYITYVDPFACAMARTYFLKWSEPIPEDLDGQADYWKRLYNTWRGKGTVQRYMQAWHDNECDKIMERYDASRNSR
jgi:hypothetical protein